MASVIRHRTTGSVLTSITDSERARLLCRGFEQYVVVDDLNARHYHWAAGRPPLGGRHPYDAEAKAALEANRDRLVAEYHSRRPIG